MDAKKKLAIFERYDFSKSALLERAEIDYENSETNLYHGMAAIVQGLIMDLCMIAGEEIQSIHEYRKLQDRVYKNYGWLQTKYQGIRWDELNADDPDFHIFFEMKQVIDNLGRSINSFLEKTGRRLGRSSEAKEYQNIESQIEKIKTLMQKYKQTKSKLKE